MKVMFLEVVRSLKDLLSYFFYHTIFLISVRGLWMASRDSHNLIHWVSHSENPQKEKG